MSNTNPSPHAFRVWNALKDEYLKAKDRHIMLLPDGHLWEFIVEDTCIWEFKELTELLPSGQPRYQIERGTTRKDKHEIQIFEGDKLESYPSKELHQVVTILYNDGFLVELNEYYKGECHRYEHPIDRWDYSKFRIIGNVHDKESEG